MHERLANAPTLPAGCALLWAEFLALHSKRGSNGYSPAPISESDLYYRQRNRGTRFEPWEVVAIEAADRAFREVYAETHKAKK